MINRPSQTPSSPPNRIRRRHRLRDNINSTRNAISASSPGIEGISPKKTIGIFRNIFGSIV